MPKIGVKDIDLYHLYTKVTNLGGMVAVSQANRWQEVFGGKHDMSGI
jgi:hypothetical protein